MASSNRLVGFRKNVLMRPNSSLKNRLKKMKTFEPVLTYSPSCTPEYLARKLHSGGYSPSAPAHSQTWHLTQFCRFRGSFYPDNSGPHEIEGLSGPGFSFRMVYNRLAHVSSQSQTGSVEGSLVSWVIFLNQADLFPAAGYTSCFDIFPSLLICFLRSVFGSQAGARLAWLSGGSNLIPLIITPLIITSEQLHLLKPSMVKKRPWTWGAVLCPHCASF